jgi:hypothetical protein
MPASTTRSVLPYPVPADSNNVPADMQRLAQAIDNILTSFSQGTLANRPAFGTAGRVYAATDTGPPVSVYYDTGAAWVFLNTSVLTLLQAKGDLLAATAAGAAARIAVGADGQALVARASNGAAGVGWENILGLPLGLTGATAATRDVGGTTTGAPLTGTFAVGDVVTAQDGAVWVCTAAGTPGTWKQVGAPLAQASVFSQAGIVSVTDGAYVSAPSGTAITTPQASQTITNPSTTRSMGVRVDLNIIASYDTNNAYTGALEYTPTLLRDGASVDSFVYTIDTGTYATGQAKMRGSRSSVRSYYFTLGPGASTTLASSATIGPPSYYTWTNSLNRFLSVAQSVLGWAL